jgi:hypothetical protein
MVVSRRAACGAGSGARIVAIMRIRLASSCWLLAILAPGCFSPPSTPFETETGSTGMDGTTGTEGTPTAGTVDDTGDPPCDGGLLCGDACVDPSTDVDHCGGCDRPCASGEVCSGGECTVACGEGLTRCDGACVDTSVDVEHCGGCSSPCAADEACESGSCVPACAEGLMACDGRCVDVATDDAHCGGCDSPCPAGEHCQAGTCEPACEPGLVECEGACIDPTDDPTHCGAGVDCAAEPGETCGGDDVCSGGTCGPVACSGFPAASFAPAITFADITQNTIVGIAWDGMSYWSVAGGSTSGLNEGQHDGAGAAVATFAPNIDFRSVFTRGDGTTEVYARGYDDPTIFVQGAPGVWSDSVDLVGGVLDPQAAVAWDPLASEHIAFNDGTLSRWDAAGVFIGTVAFLDYGALAGEHDFPQNRSIAWASGCYLTVVDDTLSAWDATGTRVDTATLEASGASFSTNLSLSVANGHVWVSDDAQWRGYAVF